MKSIRALRVLLPRFSAVILLGIILQSGNLRAQGPSNISVTPSSGTGMSQTFTAVYSDPTGYSNITEAEILIQPPSFTSFGFYDCYVYFNRYVNSLYLLADAGGPWLGPQVQAVHITGVEIGRAHV